MSDTNRAARFFDRSLPLLSVFVLAGLVVLIVAFRTVYANPADLGQHAPGPRTLHSNPASARSNHVLTHWMNEGYFHYCGLPIPTPPDKVEIYRSLSGGYMVSAFVLQKIFVAVKGHYSWRLVAIHNELIALLLSALCGLLTYRICRRFALEQIPALVLGISVMTVILTFPSNLMLYWEMTPQAYWLLFAVLFLVIEERCLDGRRTLPLTIVQAAAAFLMTYMEHIAGLAFVFVMGVVFLLLGQRHSWKRFLLVALAPALVAVTLYELQLFVVAKRFPDTPTSGSTFIFRSGLDGESLYYGDHLDIAYRRDVASNNWPANRQYLFRWKWVFFGGVIAAVGLIAAYVRGRAPRFAIDVVFSLTGAWLVYAAVFSQAVMIHPYLYDVILFTPLAVALFALAPALAESLTRRSGVFVLIAFLCAFWYSLFQMRLYAMQYPVPGTAVGQPAK